MHPILFEVGPLAVRSYGALLAISFLLGVTFAARRARGAGLDPDLLLSMAWTIVVAGVGGARILYVLQHPGEFAGDLLGVFRVWEGGLTLYGGLILASLTTIFYLRRRTDRPWGYTDALAPFVALGEGITRVGCFLNGCCFGRECALPWGVTYPASSHAADIFGHPHLLHPSQLYQSILAVGVFAITSWVWHRRRFDGQVFWLWVILDPLARVVADLFRYYEPGQVTMVGPLHLAQSQITSVVMMLIGVVGYRLQRRGRMGGEVAAS